MLIRTKLGPRLEYKDIGIWIIPEEKRISLFIEPNSKLVKLLPKDFWDEKNNIYQKSFYTK